MFSVRPQECALVDFLLPGSLLGDRAQHCDLSGFAHWPLTALSAPLPSGPSTLPSLSISDPGLHTSQAKKDVLGFHHPLWGQCHGLCIAVLGLP